jgi:hypothetical protein
MSHVVTSYSWAYKSGNVQDTMAWIGEMSEKGWELKGFSVTAHPETRYNGQTRVDEWNPTAWSFMQRPAQTANALQRWQYPD